jgi:hypothetical protein
MNPEKLLLFYGCCPQRRSAARPGVVAFDGVHKPQFA